MPSVPRLLINADDFGLTAGVNRAIAQLHTAGVLPSATLMACGSAFHDAVSTAAAHPTLDVGCHVVLVDGSPTVPTSRISSLVTTASHFRSSLPAFVADLYRGRIRERDIQAEAEAQIRTLQQAGIRVTHVDTHKHTHLFPRVARPLVRAAINCGVPAIRNPFEPAWCTRLTRNAVVRKAEVTLLRTFHQAFQKLTRQHHIATTDGCVGVSATGTLDTASLSPMLSNLPPGTWELVCHPGYNDTALGAIHTRLRSTREVERDALLRAIPPSNIPLHTFADLP